MNEDQNENPNAVGIEAHEMIEGLTNRISQLVIDGVVKDILIRRLQDQLQGTKGTDELK